MLKSAKKNPNQHPIHLEPKVPKSSLQIAGCFGRGRCHVEVLEYVHSVTWTFLLPAHGCLKQGQIHLQGYGGCEVMSDNTIKSLREGTGIFPAALQMSETTLYMVSGGGNI